MVSQLSMYSTQRRIVLMSLDGDWKNVVLFFGNIIICFFLSTLPHTKFSMFTMLNISVTWEVVSGVDSNPFEYKYGGWMNIEIMCFWECLEQCILNILFIDSTSLGRCGCWNNVPCFYGELFDIHWMVLSFFWHHKTSFLRQSIQRYLYDRCIHANLYLVSFFFLYFKFITSF